MTYLTSSADSPQVHPRTIGAPGRTRYGYVSLGRHDERFHGAVFHGVMKLDLLEEREVGRVDFGPNLWGGETLFVPAAADGMGAEDAGYLLNILRDNVTDAASLVIYDAATMDDEPLAKVHLVGHVPYGFHAGYLSAAEVERLVPAPR